jgi:hypothetical protein
MPIHRTLFLTEAGHRVCRSPDRGRRALVWHTVEVVLRILRDLFNRPFEPMWFRFILQPTTALIVAVRDGVKDARTGCSPYCWTVLSNPHERVERLREGLNATVRIILLGLVMDVIYQLIVLKTLYPGENLIVASCLPLFLTC